MNKTLRKAMISTIAMLVVGVMSLTGVTYAWFTQGTTAAVEDIELSVSDASGGLQIGMIKNDVVVWGTSAKAPKMTDKLTPVSTDGKVTNGTLKFLSGAINGTTLEAIQTSSSYYTFDIYFRNDGNNAIDVILDNTTALLVADQAATTGRSDYATRIAFIPSDSVTIKASMADTDFTLRNESIIYEPNATLHTDGAKIEKTASGWGPSELANAKWTYKALSTTASYEKVDRYNGSELVAMNTRLTTSNETIVTVNAHCACKVTVYVWVEGQDADCINENAGATFMGAIKFKLPDQVPENT